MNIFLAISISIQVLIPSTIDKVYKYPCVHWDQAFQPYVSRLGQDLLPKPFPKKLGFQSLLDFGIAEEGVQTISSLLFLFQCLLI